MFAMTSFQTQPRLSTSEALSLRDDAIRSWRVLLLLFATSFVVYETCLASVALRPYNDFWFFGADNHRFAFTRPGTHPFANVQIVKHPFFVAVGVPLHWCGRALFGWIQDPYGTNLSLSFPVAVMGAMSVCLAWLIFRTLGFTRRNALLPTLLYGVSASIWVFSSFPDTYIGTTLATNAFLLCVLLRPQAPVRLSLLNAAACFFAPQQILLAIIPCTHVLRKPGWKTAMRYSLIYGSVLLVCFLIPYRVFLVVFRKTEFVDHFVTAWGSWDQLASPDAWVLVGLAFLFFSEIAPSIDPRLLDPLGTAALYALPAGTWILFLAIACYAAVRLPKTLRDRSFPGIPIALFSAAYIGFFVFWDSEEAFLFTAPALMPLWLTAHRGYVEFQHSRIWKTALLIGCAVVALNNWRFIQTLKDDSGLVAGLRTRPLTLLVKAQDGCSVPETGPLRTFGYRSDRVRTITPTDPFKGRQYPGEVILMALPWYLRYPLAYLHVSEPLSERGLFVDGQLRLAVAPGIWAGDRQTLPTASKADEQELPVLMNPT